MIKTKEHLMDIHRVDGGKQSRKDYLRLDMNENPSGLPADFIRETLSSVDANYLSTYPEYAVLQERIARHNNLESGNICLANGSDGAIKYIFETFIEPGDRVLLTDPTFAMYPIYCRMFKAEPVLVSYDADFLLPLDRFIDELSGNIKMAVIVNPNNPTGSALTKEQMALLLETAQKYNVLLVIDEAYFYYYKDTVITDIKKYDNLIVLRTFSKLCGIAALRIGYAAASVEIAQQLRIVRPTYDVNGMAVLFAIKLLDHPEVITRMTEEVNRGRKFLVAKLKENNIPYVNGLANFVLVHCGKRAEEVKEKLKLKNILIGGPFQPDFLKDYLRVSLGNESLMSQFFESFLAIWNKDR